MGTKGMKMRGVECPECGDIRTGVTNAGLDSEGNRIRRRNCHNCEVAFTTVEVPIAFNFTAMDVAKPMSDVERLRESSTVRYRAVPRRDPDRFQVKVDSNTITIKLIKGTPSDWCRRGLHKLVGHNNYVRANGHRQCRECINARARDYRREFRRRFPQVARERDAVRRDKERERRARQKAA